MSLPAQRAAYARRLQAGPHQLGRRREPKTRPLSRPAPCRGRSRRTASRWGPFRSPTLPPISDGLPREGGSRVRHEREEQEYEFIISLRQSDVTEREAGGDCRSEVQHGTPHSSSNVRGPWKGDGACEPGRGGNQRMHWNPFLTRLNAEASTHVTGRSIATVYHLFLTCNTTCTTRARGAAVRRDGAEGVFHVTSDVSQLVRPEFQNAKAKLQ